MRQLLAVAMDLLREARARKWVLGLFGGVTLLLLVLAFALKLEVVDGAIAGSRLFGALLFDDVVDASAAMRPVLMASAWVLFYVGALFLSVACSDFASELLSPGRIEHLLSLPVARWQLLFGTYLGVLLLTAGAALYGAAGVTVLFGFKIGVWTFSLLQGALLGIAGFAALYAAMVLATFVVRSAAFAAAAGIVTLVLGIVSSLREDIAPSIDEGFGRTLFVWAMKPIPRLAMLATQGAHLAGGKDFDAGLTLRITGGCLVFAAALLVLAWFRFEKKDF